MLGVARSEGGAAWPAHSSAAAWGIPASNAINDAVARRAAVVTFPREWDRTLVMATLWHSQAETNLKFRLSLASGWCG
jgi:hypothetical protein